MNIVLAWPVFFTIYNTLFVKNNFQTAATLNESVTFRNGVLDVSVTTKFPFYFTCNAVTTLTVIPNTIYDYVKFVWSFVYFKFADKTWKR